MPGELLDSEVLVASPAEASRLLNKGQYGRPQSGGGLRLDLVEAAYLVEAGRLEVRLEGRTLEPTRLLVEAARRRPGFEIPYLVYRDYRERGHLLHPSRGAERKAGVDFVNWGRGGDRSAMPQAWVRAVSEREPFELRRLRVFAEGARDAGARAQVAVVDEESDVTHYELSTDPPQGPQRPSPAAGIEGVLMEDRVVVSDAKAAEALYRAEFFGKPVAASLHLSLLEATFLVERGDLAVRETPEGRLLSASALRRRAKELESTFDERAVVYRDLRSRGLIVKTGYKFGTHFRAYEGQPDEAHAPYLVQAVSEGFQSSWEPIARAVRLSHSVRKRFYLGAVGRGVAYVSLGRFRP